MAGFNMNNLVAQVAVGSGYSVAMLNTDKTDKYDIVLAHDGRGVCTMSNGCVGIKSAEFWHKNHIKSMARMVHLTKDIDKAAYNMMCYSTNMLMDKPREGYEAEFNEAKDEYNMLREWLSEMVDGMINTSYDPSGTEATLADWLRIEFDNFNE